MKKEIPALTQPPAPEGAERASASETPESKAADVESLPPSEAVGDDRTESATAGGDAQGEGAPVEGASSGTAAASVAVGSGSGGGARRALPLILSVIALVAVAVIGWYVQQLRGDVAQARQELAQRLATGESSVAEARALVRQHQDSIAAIQGKIGALESQIAASEGQAAALDALYQEFFRSRGDQVLAEVERAINIAAQQLQLAGNVEAALIALQGAEVRLSMPEQGHLQVLRRALIKDIDDLKAQPQVDVSGLALRLEILLERVDSLPLAYEVALAQEAAAASDGTSGGFFGEAGALAFVKGLGSDIWNEVKSLVRLERLDRADPVLLSPSQSTYLRENVKIRLLTARLALLARDGRTYAADLAQAKGWIERYFDMRDEQVQRVVTDLGELAETQVKVEQPSLAESFAALRVLQARGPGRAAPRDEAPAAAGAR